MPACPKNMFLLLAKFLVILLLGVSPMFLFAADLHIKRRIWSKIRNIVGDAAAAFSQLVQYAIENDATAIVLGADIFDPPDSYSIDVYEQMLREYPGVVYGIEGQHDRGNPPWLMIDSIPGIYVDRKIFEIDGYRLYALSNMPEKILKDELVNVPEGVDFLVLHQMLKDLVPSWTLDPEWVPSHVKTVLMGDYHTCYKTKYYGTTYYYPGSLSPQKINEIYTSGHFFAIEDGKIETKRVKGRHIDRIQVSSREALDLVKTVLDKIDEKAGNYLPSLQPLIMIEYDVRIENIAASLSSITTRYPYTFHYIPSIAVESLDDETTIISASEMRDHVANFTGDADVQLLICDLLDTVDRRAIDVYRETVLGDNK